VTRSSAPSPPPPPLFEAGRGCGAERDGVGYCHVAAFVCVCVCVKRIWRKHDRPGTSAIKGQSSLKSTCTVLRGYKNLTSHRPGTFTILPSTFTILRTLRRYRWGLSKCVPVEPRAWAGAREGAGVKLEEVAGGG
jgi:hypothetical protein